MHAKKPINFEANLISGVHYKNSVKDHILHIVSDIFEHICDKCLDTLLSCRCWSVSIL